MYGTLLLLHLLAATIWTGGHIILATVILPKALRQRSVAHLQNFETAYERVGMPALIVQIITGLMLAYRLVPDIGGWFNPANPLAHIIMAKLTLLGLTLALAIDARFRVIPNLTPDKLVDMAFHIVPVTLISILFVVVGISIRTGWLF
ncbi:CopD family protein [Neiella marina]|uniref:CopD family protein n=1 Tax=Neiella holothuriorum TaxID=2870530 RepID=A0ABS7EF67_9GAMM|nr:CopD family protein [Neiella holothuriorum]MBW8190568.1 CopD family protein [Neiella holothuriorum]